MEADPAMEGLAIRLQHVLDIISEGRRTLRVPEASDWKALALPRWQMLRALNDFATYKHNKILDPLMASADAATAGRARLLSAENERLQKMYSEFSEHWVLNSPVALDARYRDAALTMAREIERRVIADVQIIDALLSRQPVRSAD